MRAHADAACRHLIVNERREAGASLPHTHAQLYALDFVPAAVARERERFGAYAVRTMGGNLLGDYVQEEVRRRERIVAIDDEAVLMAPYASRVPFHLMLAPRRDAGALRGRRPDRRRAAARRAAPAAGAARREPAAEPLGAHRAERRGALLLADRDPAAARRTSPGSSSAPACTCASTRPSRPRPSCASCEGARPARQPRERDRRRRGDRRDRPRAARAARRHPHRHARPTPTGSPRRSATCACSRTPRAA